MSISTLRSPSRSLPERSTPKNVFCGSKNSRPAWISFGPSCRTQATRQRAFCEPRCKITVSPGCNAALKPPRRAPAQVISTECASWVATPTETFTGNTVFLRGWVRLSGIVSIIRSGVGPKKLRRSRTSRTLSKESRILRCEVGFSTRRQIFPLLLLNVAR